MSHNGPQTGWERTLVGIAMLARSHAIYEIILNQVDE